ncbi:MAG: hypothetical protein FJW86_09105 [Actinobacteria bacterium]|nr:hypothetical protein [Actinomycetota bacterium]
MAQVPEHDHIIDTGKSHLTLEELGHVQPGMARVMPEVGARIWKCYYAGKAKNKPLAAFQLKEAVNLMEMGVLLRPKYTDNMYKFIEEQVDVVKKAIDSEDWDGFQAAFQEMVEHANAYHELYDKPYLRWKIPEMPPPDMDMTPRG